MKSNASPKMCDLIAAKASLQSMYRNAKGDTRRQLGTQIDSVKSQIKALKKEKEDPQPDKGATVIPMTVPGNNPAARQTRHAISNRF